MKTSSAVAFIFILCLLLVLPASAASNAATTAQQINTLLAGKCPYTIELTPAQMAGFGFDSFNLTNNRSTFKITVKSASYNANEETAILYINAWRDGQSVRVNNPIHWYVPFSGGIHGANAATQLRNFIWLNIVYLDNIPLGDPINDDTLVAYAGYDGYLQEGTDQEWGPMRDDTGDGVVASPATYEYCGYTVATTTTNVYTYHRRCGYSINTSVIPDSGTISSAVLSIDGISEQEAVGTVNLSLIDFSPGNSLAYGNGDYDNTTFTRLSSDIPYASFSTSWNNFTLNAAGLARISKTGYTPLLFTHSADVDDTGLSWSSSGISGYRLSSVAAAAPFLTIVYSEGGDTTPPLSITNLLNGTPSCSAVDFSWENPGDTDFGGLQHYKNNILQSNLSNVSESITYTSLSAETEYTISLRTFDLAGNINSTFVNRTITTTACTTPTPTPTATPLSGCIFTNVTGVTVLNGSTSWTVTKDNLTWGSVVENATLGNVSLYACIGTPTPTITPTSTEFPNFPAIHKPWDTILAENWYWLLAIIAVLVIFKR